MRERNFYEAVAHRRTNYALGKNIPVTEKEIVETVEKVTGRSLRPSICRADG